MASQFSQVSDHVLSIEGDLDVYSVADAIKQGSKLIKSNQSIEMIDLRDVNKIDSAGLAFIIELMKIAQKNKTKIQFKNIPARMHAVAEIYGLSQILPDRFFQSS